MGFHPVDHDDAIRVPSCACHGYWAPDCGPPGLNRLGLHDDWAADCILRDPVAGKDGKLPLPTGPAVGSHGRNNEWLAPFCPHPRGDDLQHAVDVGDPATARGERDSLALPDRPSDHTSQLIPDGGLDVADGGHGQMLPNANEERQRLHVQAKGKFHRIPFLLTPGWSWSDYSIRACVEKTGFQQAQPRDGCDAIRFAV